MYKTNRLEIFIKVSFQCLFPPEAALCTQNLDWFQAKRGESITSTLENCTYTWLVQ